MISRKYIIHVTDVQASVRPLPHIQHCAPARHTSPLSLNHTIATHALLPTQPEALTYVYMEKQRLVVMAEEANVVHP
jgi:hypothetical protein